MGYTSSTGHESPTGATLRLYTRRAETDARGVVQINHGLAEHAGRYARFADFLAAHGFHVYAHDHRGHGRTKAPDAPPGMFSTQDGTGKLLADVDAIHDLIALEHPGLPVIVFGHSMGGMVALNHVLKHPSHVRGAAIWNANFSAGFTARAALAFLAWERFRLGADVPSRILPRLTFRTWAKQISNAGTDFDWLSQDAAEVAAYRDDPLCGWDASVSMWRDIFGLAVAGADDRNFADVPRDLPFHLLGGADDPATEGGKAVTVLADRLRAMGFSNVVSTIRPATRHETLNEIGREAAMADFVAWACSVLAREPP
ncbi:alpha/beta fold hydrolase [Mesorhizobium xinjiangense]|uniref:alpha/beta fold hydrolase n=1 Tax=Mesorhizobium xinjiangense TaxID=2678685 RepID=UPI0012EDC2B9